MTVMRVLAVTYHFKIKDINITIIFQINPTQLLLVIKNVVLISRPVQSCAKLLSVPWEHTMSVHLIGILPIFVYDN